VCLFVCLFVFIFILKKLQTGLLMSFTNYSTWNMCGGWLMDRGGVAGEVGGEEGRDCAGCIGQCMA
jgi:hypothetical protein